MYSCSESERGLAPLRDKEEGQDQRFTRELLDLNVNQPSSRTGINAVEKSKANAPQPLVSVQPGVRLTTLLPLPPSGHPDGVCYHNQRPPILVSQVV